MNPDKHSGAVDKSKGHAKELIGSAKEKVGSVLGNEELEAKGRLQNAEGKKDRVKGEIKEAIDDVKATAKAGADVVREKLGGTPRDRH